MGASQAVYIVRHKGKDHRLLWVLHSCGNELCINGAHLYLGTPTDNARDRKRHARSDQISGPKLAIEVVTKIRELYAGGLYTQVDLANLFGVTRVTVNHIVNYVTWKE